ncbi:hypothetical protein G5714_020858 [Onychostoma macrolepis]|uniref:Uncharacterized protein n=1 Tax=Onychostoma macrolepis TaxID=369639 RepID=A0A7J6BV35_9TELE|nr:hypothetical protein G5714_020858 [Onychostoma macrolepis]
MAAQQDRGRAEDAIFIADMLLAQNKAKEAKGKATSAYNKFNVRWVEKDAEGCSLLKRSRSGETRKRASATVLSVWRSCFAPPFVLFLLPAALGLWLALRRGFSLPVRPSLHDHPFRSSFAHARRLLWISAAAVYDLPAAAALPCWIW